MNGGCKVGSTCTQSGWVRENLIIETHTNQTGVKSLLRIGSCSSFRGHEKEKKHDGKNGVRLDQFSRLLSNGLWGEVEG